MLNLFRKIRVDNGVVRMGGLFWKTKAVMLSPELDAKVLSTLQDGRWYRFSELKTQDSGGK